MGWGPRAAPSQSWPSYPVGPARRHARTTPPFVAPAMGPTGMSCQILAHCRSVMTYALCLLDDFSLVLLPWPSMKIWPHPTRLHLHGENLGLFRPRSVGDTAAAGGSPAAPHGGGTGTGTLAVAEGVLVHEDLPAPALHAAERPVASACTSSHIHRQSNTRTEYLYKTN